MPKGGNRTWRRRPSRSAMGSMRVEVECQAVEKKASKVGEVCLSRFDWLGFKEHGMGTSARGV